MNQIERWAGDVFFLGRAQAADDSLGERCLASAEIALQQYQDRRAQIRANFATLCDRFFGGAGEEFFHSRTGFQPVGFWLNAAEPFGSATNFGTLSEIRKAALTRVKKPVLPLRARIGFRD